MGFNNFIYIILYSKKDYKVTADKTIGLGLSDEEFFKQSIPKLTSINKKYDNWYGVMIMLSNHTPFSDTEKYGDFAVDIKEKVVNEDMENILVKIIELSRTLKSSYDEKTLNYITDYLYDLCSLFNKFYSKYNIINEKDEQIKNSYIAMINLIYNTCSKLLDILAIETVETM